MFARRLDIDSLALEMAHRTFLKMDEDEDVGAFQEENR